MAIRLALRIATRLPAPLLVLGLATGIHAASLPDFETLVSRHPHVAALARLARDHGVTFGIYGGTVRDLVLERPFTVISDVDLIYDHRDPGFPAFRDALLDYHHAHRSAMPTPDFHYDRGEAGTPRQEHFHRTGITATKVGVLASGRVLDPTGTGVRDLMNRVCRFDAPDPHAVPRIQNLGRYVRDLARLPDFRHEVVTLIRFRRAFDRAHRTDRADGRILSAVVANLRAAGDPLTFPAVLESARHDVRVLHHGRGEQSPAFPLSLLWLDVFKTVTQAPDLTEARRVFRTTGLAPFLERIGFAAEIGAIMDPGHTRDDLFARFRFPGHGGSGTPIDPADHEREARRKSDYARAFEAVARGLPRGSFARTHLARRRAAFLSPGSWTLLAPGPDPAPEIMAYLDTDFSIGVLDREATRRALRTRGDPLGRPDRRSPGLVRRTRDRSSRDRPPGP